MRDIIINRIDEKYHSRVVTIVDPKTIVAKLRELKRCEVNITSSSARLQLSTIRYDPQKESVHDFCLRFEDLIRKYESCEGVPVLTEFEKRDAFYNAVVPALPALRTADIVRKAATHEQFKYEELKSVVAQIEAETAVTQKEETAFLFRRNAKDRCKVCNDYGHKESECSWRGTGLKNCYACNQFTTHKAYECPTRKNSTNFRSSRCHTKPRFRNYQDRSHPYDRSRFRDQSRYYDQSGYHDQPRYQNNDRSRNYDNRRP